jgi:V8-like Glu-specific endopeptidase
MKIFKLAFLFFYTLSLIGCSSKGGQPLLDPSVSSEVSHSEKNIMGKKNKPFFNKDNIPLMNDKKLHCSAYLIHPRLYLTAAHCLEKFFPTPNFAKKIERLIPFPGFSKEDPENKDRDIGLILLKTKHKKMKFDALSFGDSEQLQVNDKVVLYAYGEPDSGKLQKASFSIKEILPSQREIVIQSDLSGTGFGDSGGPVFVLDKKKHKHLIGVNSRRYSKREIEWEQGAIISLITPEVKEWIEEQLD